MDNRIHVCFNANDRSYFAILKKEIHLLAVAAGLDKKVAEIDIVVAEIVSNLVKHGGGGQLLVKLVNEENKKGIELLSIDNGVGMTDVTRMVSDGVSTKNSLGQGLGAMKRLSDIFQVYSLKNWGTIILCRIFESEYAVHTKQPSAEIRSIILPKTNEKACGDGFCSIVTDKEVRVFSGDGLGHGPEAELAVEKAIEAFKKCTERSSVEVIRYINSQVKKTRGLVGTAAIYHFDERKWSICGIGNILTKINSLDSANGYMSYNGIIGLNMPNTLKEREFTYEEGQYIIMCSDGIKSRWDTTRYPAILRYDASILAAAILKDYARHTDDMSVAVCKLNLS
jgi:anti-sigma regulatory factor (Ser/Thr protein kinase)